MSDELPYGTWPSPITPELIVQAAVGLGEVVVDGRHAWWSELRPEEGGRVQLVRRPVDASWPATDVLPNAHAARTRVHEYGGGAWCVAGGTVVFANWDDQRLYRLGPDDETPLPLTRPSALPHGLRYADGRLTPDRAWAVCVRESHEAGGEAVNELVAVPVDEPADAVTLVSGPDFVAAPRLSPDGAWLAWIQWSHPAMPWDATELWVGRLERSDGPGGGALDLVDPRRVAGGPRESVVQPTWSPAGVLHFLTDRHDTWQLHRLEAAGGSTSGDEGIRLLDLAADIGTPPWVFGMQRYAFLGDDALAVVAAVDGVDQLFVVRTAGTDEGRCRSIDCGLTALTSLSPDGAGGVVAIGASFEHEPAVVLLADLARLVPDAGVPTGAAVVEARHLRPPRDLGLEATWWSVPRHITFPTGPEGEGGLVAGEGDTAHALFYPPTNPHCRGPASERPPLVVAIHGGPTSAARAQLQLGIQFWTSRGFGVVDVNYRGSTGYGRAFRELLDGCWGVADVEDCVAAATWLAAAGEVDGERLAIHGGSAGGFTTLMALIRSDRFSAGTSSYGVTDLEALARDTHKFESRYLDGLVGAYPAERERYVERSPIHHLDLLDDPVLLLQGLEDEIVPPSQAELMVEALRRNRVPFAYLAFEGEQHGFRQAATIRRALEAELFFYARVFGFAPPVGVEPIEIEHLPAG